jgi:TonB family protein
MLTKKLTAVFSFLMVASSVALADPADNAAAASSVTSAGGIDVQACSKPAYPTRWVDDGTSGNVVMDVLVGADGTVLESKLVQSSGYRRVDHASVRAVEHCKVKVDSAQSAPAWSRLTYAWVIE